MKIKDYIVAGILVITLCVYVIPFETDAALSITHLTDGVSTSDPATSAEITATAGSVVFLTVGVAVSGGAVTFNNISIGGTASISWSQVEFIGYASRRGLWVYQGTVAGDTTGTVTMDYTGGFTYQETMWSIDMVTGVDSGDPIDAPVEHEEIFITSITLPDVGTPDDGDYIFAAYGYENAANGFALDGAYTTLALRNGGANLRTLATGYDSTPFDETPSASWSTDGHTGGIAFIINADPDTSKSNVPYALNVTAEGKARMMFMSSGITYSATSTTDVDDGEWHHVVGTYDGDAVKVYVDGVLEDTNSSPSGNLPTGIGPLRIGADYQAVPAGFFLGSIDDVRLFGRALSATEVRTLFGVGNAIIRSN